MHSLPIFLDLKHRSCLVIGGGDIAARKIDMLCRAGADVTVVAPEFAAAVAARGDIKRIADNYRPEALDGHWLVIAATDDEKLNARIAADAGERRIFVNVVDDPANCSFIVPSIVDRSPIVVAVSSGGEAPVLARMLRARLETFIPSAYGELGRMMGAFRARVRERFPDLRPRRRFWETIVQGPVAELLFSGQREAASRRLESALADAEHGGDGGEVWLVGAGPGDPDLLTFRALRLMQQAEVVVYDRLVAPELLDLTRRDADKVYVGKERDQHTLPQESINQFMIDKAREGLRVLRLKGGDPFVFGRGGEEIETLAEAGVPFQIVPGISAANGCAAYAGIPLTHRDYAQSCLLVTGHRQDGSVNLNWEALVQPAQTVVIFMGLHGLDIICRELLAHGASPALPAAIIERGTQPDQRVVTTELGALAECARELQPRPPALLILGEVVRLRERLAWFETAPTEPATEPGG